MFWELSPFIWIAIGVLWCFLAIKTFKFKEPEVMIGISVFPWCAIFVGCVVCSIDGFVARRECSADEYKVVVSYAKAHPEINYLIAEAHKDKKVTLKEFRKITDEVEGIIDAWCKRGEISAEDYPKFVEMAKENPRFNYLVHKATADDKVTYNEYNALRRAIQKFDQQRELEKGRMQAKEIFLDVGERK